MQATGSKGSRSVYRLSIHVLVGGFSVSVDDLAGQQILQVGKPWVEAGNQSHAEVLRAVLTDARVSSRTYARVELVSHAPSTYVPVELFRRSDMPSIYRLTFSNVRVNNADIRHRILPGMDVVEIYSIPQPLARVVEELYPQVDMSGRAGQLVGQAAGHDRKLPATEQRVHVHMDADELHVCLLTGGQLRFACAYPASADADRIYYLMAAWRTLGLDAGRTPCLLWGDAASLEKELMNYIMNVETCA